MRIDYSYTLFVCPFFLLLILVSGLPASAQVTPTQQRDTSGHHPLHKKIADSAKSVLDTALKGSRQLLQVKKEQVKDKLLASTKPVKDIPRMLTGWKKDSLSFDWKNPFRNLSLTRPAIRFTGGHLSYQFNYRSSIDTPYVEKDIAQHNTTGNLFFTVAGMFPVRATFWSRQSNSKLFRDITDVQVSFNGAEFRNQLQTSLRDRLLQLAPHLRDSLTEKLYALKKLNLDDLKNLLSSSFSLQCLTEANEILRVPGITYQAQLPDSTNKRREDSLRKVAATFLELYAATKQRYDRLAQQVDSLKQQYQKSIVRIQQFRKMIGGKAAEYLSPRQWKNNLQQYGLNEIEIPAKYKWLMGLRNFSVGRSTVNYSELTAKNISVNGINVEYNSWYYLAVSAGMVDYRFRDFSINGVNKKPQFLYLVRAGIGRLEKNYFILSAFRGQKQLFAASRLSSITVSGLSAETRWQVNDHTWLTAEIAKSIAPDYRQNPPQATTKFNLSDKTNQAVALRFYTYWPVTQTRLEGSYRKTGANFQSFSSFQTNAEMESWSVKADQAFFNRKLRIAAAVRKNEFSNPFIVQDYKSNTVFKSITATFRMRKWPVITAGYQPMSQLTVLDDRVIENRFQTFTSSLYHMYSIRRLRVASTLMVNKFYNNNTDTGFIYYNATNVYWLQNFFFKHFTASIAVSHTKNSGYTLNVLDESIQLNLTKLGSAGFGVKINNLDNLLIKVGGYVNASIRVWKQDILYLSYERGYLPGFFKGLTRNEMATVQFVKTF